MRRPFGLNLRAFTFILLATVQFAGPVRADDCNKFIHDQLTPRELYNFLLRRDPKFSNSGELFEDALKNPSFRSELNALIESDKDLNKAAKAGLKGKETMAAWLKTRLPNGSSQSEPLLYPAKHFWNLYQSYKKTLKVLRDRPMSEQTAALNSRYDTANLYGIDPNYTESDLQLRSDRFEIQKYYNKRLNRYLLSDEQKLLPPELVETTKLKSWLKKTREHYQQLRSKNLLNALVMISEHDRRDLRLAFISNATGKRVGRVKLTEDARAGIKSEIGISEPGKDDVAVNAGKLKPFYAVDQLDGGVWYANAANVWNRLLGLYSMPYLVPNQAIDPNASLEVFTFTMTDREFNRTLSNKMGITDEFDIPDEVTYSIEAKDIQLVLADYIKRSAKTNLDLDIEFADTLKLLSDYDQTLAANVQFIDSNLERLVPNKFEASLKELLITEAKMAEKLGAGHSASSLLFRMRQLDQNAPADLVTGIEWYGYRYDHNFWALRDGTFKDRSSLALWWREKVSKASLLKKMFTAMVPVGLFIGMLFPHREGILETLAEGISNGIEKIAPQSDHQPKPQSQNNKNKNKKEQVVFNEFGNIPDTTSRELVKDRLPNAPLFFDHAGQVELEDSANLIQLPMPAFDLSKARSDSVYERVGLYTNDRETYLEADSGYLFIPRPEGFDIYQLDVTTIDGHSMKEIADGFYVHPKTGQYLLKLKPAFRKSHFSLGANYQKLVSREFSVEESLQINGVIKRPRDRFDYQDARFKHMDRAKLDSINHLIKSAGLEKLAEQLEHSYDLASGKPNGITLEVISKTLRESQYYKGDVAELTDSVFANPFDRYRPYLNWDGKLAIKCDIANRLLRDILSTYYSGQPDIRFGHYRSWVLDKTQYIDNTQTGKITSEQHERLQILTEGRSGVVVLDATSSKKPPPKPAIVELKKILESTEPPSPPRTSTAPIGDAKGPDPSLAEKHLEMLSKLETQLKSMVENSTLRTVVKQKKGVMLPQRVFKLAKQVEYFAKKEISFESFVANVHDLYSEQGLITPATDTQIIDLFEQIESFEISEWKRLLDLADTQARTNPYTRHSESFYWLDDYALKTLVLDMLALLKSYSWVQP